MRSEALICIIFTALMLSACGGASAPAEPVNAANQAVKNTALPPANTALANSPVNTNATVNIQTQQDAEDSPTIAIKALSEAAKRKDTAAIKALFNRESLERVAKQAKANEASLDETLLNQQIVVLAENAADGRNQKINGDNATVEIRTVSSKRWQTIYFTREDGRWKIAMDKFMDEIMRQVEESMKALEKDSAKEDKKSSDEGDK